jgi:hypothetical protein
VPKDVKIGVGKDITWWFYVGGGDVDRLINATKMSPSPGTAPADTFVRAVSMSVELKPCVGKTSIGEARKKNFLIYNLCVNIFF